MTDLLDRPAGDAAPGPEPETERGKEGVVPPAGPGHRVVAAALVGAAAIHLAMTPSHLGESAIEGAGFLAAAWAQAVLAVAVVWRPTRRTLVAVIALSVALIGAWIVSRTAGLPFGDHAGHAESVSLVDGLCVALEAVAAITAAALAFGIAPRLTRSAVFGVVGTVAALGLGTGAVASPSARDHAAGSHGAHGAGDESGHGHDMAAAEDDKGFSLMSNGHQHMDTPDDPLTTEERVTLARQLSATTELIEAYPTLGAAKAAGWRRAGPFVPGLGTHYSGPGRFSVNSDGDMDPEDLRSPILVFDGLDDDAALAGFMYMAYGRDTAPEGFAGPNDVWHYHEALCIVMGPDGNLDTPFGADLEGVTEQMCTDVGGSWVATTGFMVHVWNVPGYESPDGMFYEVNRKITCPDGTYYKIPTETIGDKDSVCRNP